MKTVLVKRNLIKILSSHENFEFTLFLGMDRNLPIQPTDTTTFWLIATVATAAFVLMKMSDLEQKLFQFSY